MKHKKSKNVEILLVEDNPGDVRLMRLALKDTEVKNNVNVVENGEDAMHFLLQNGEYANAPRPDIIILDLNLPKRDGREVLAEIKKDSSLKRIPVVILTTSSSEEDINKTYDLYANSYITKPVKWDQFINVMKFIEKYWLNIVKLPTEM